MSQASHARRLRCLERTGGNPELDEWMAAVREIEYERSAALALAEFAQALGGVEPPVPAPVRAAPLSPQQPMPPPRSRRRIWGPGNWPSVHDVLTWEEAIQLQSIVETPVEANPCLPAEDQSSRPKGWVAPYSHGDFVFPSYAQETEGDADNEGSDGES